MGNDFIAYCTATDARDTAYDTGNRHLLRQCSDVACEALNDYGPATEDAAYACAVFAAQASLDMAAA